MLWINVRDQLPGLYEDVLICTSDGYVSIGKLLDKSGNWLYNLPDYTRMYSSNVDWWMSKPERPLQ